MGQREIAEIGHPSPRFHPVLMKDAECAETNEKLIFRFLAFEIWSFFYSKLVHFQLILSTKLTITKK